MMVAHDAACRAQQLRLALARALATALMLCITPATAKLLVVYSVQRHGARNVLPKTALLAEGSIIGGPTLLPQGQRQTYLAGENFRYRYISDSRCNATATCLPDNAGGAASNATAAAAVPGGDNYGVYGTPGVGYGNFDVYVRSSSLDRSIMSGLCFFNGIFPAVNPANATAYLPTGAQVVPIYTQNDPDDVLIRAYTKCPAYQDALVEWYGSPEFKAKEAETQDLRNQDVRDAAICGARSSFFFHWPCGAAPPLREPALLLQPETYELHRHTAQVKAIMPSADVALVNWWNVYDAINVWQNYGVGDPTPFFNATLFKQVQGLAYWLETAKMRSNLTRNLLGGVLLADVLDTMDNAINATQHNSQLYYKLVSISSHYNTQLGLLGALAVDTVAQANEFPWLQNIPKLAAVLVLELHSVSNNLYVRVLAQDGPNATYVAVQLPCSTQEAGQAVGSGACTWERFRGQTSPRALTEQGWCAACGNTDASVCRLRQLQQAADSDNGLAWKVAVAAVVSFVGVLLCLGLALAVRWAVRRRRTEQYHQRDAGGGSSEMAQLSKFPRDPRAQPFVIVEQAQPQI